MYGQYKNVIDQQEYLISDNIIMKQLGRIMAYRAEIYNYNVNGYRNNQFFGGTCRR